MMNNEKEEAWKDAIAGRTGKDHENILG